MEKSQEDIRALAKKIDDLTFEKLMDSFSPADIKENSILANKLLNHGNPDPGWVKFAHQLGAFELAIGEAHKDLQVSIDTSLQLLMVMTGAQDQMQLLEYAQRLKKVERALPSLFQEYASGLYAGQAAAQQQLPIVYPQLPGVGAGTASPSAESVYTDYVWNAAAKAAGGPAPQALAGVLLFASGAQIASVNDRAIGVAVSVDAAAKVVKAAVNGQTIKDIPAAFMTGLQLGDELISTATPVGGRYLITMAEALAAGVTPGSPVKVIARVKRNDASERSILITDQALQPLAAS